MLLEQLQESIREDLEALDTLDSETPGVDPRSDAISRLREDLESLGIEVHELGYELHHNDLPAVQNNNQASNPQDNSEASNSQDNSDASKPQDSSDIYQTEFDSADYYDD